MTFRPRCTLLGDPPVLKPLAEALSRTNANISSLVRLPTDGFAKDGVPDYLFISTDVGIFEIRRAVKAVSDACPSSRVVLIDADGGFEYAASDLGAHSLINLGEDSADMAARYWADANLASRP